MNRYQQQRALIRAALGRPPVPAVPSAVAPPVVPAVAAGGACAGCETGCSGCVRFVETECDRCGTGGADQSWETLDGQRILDLHSACVPAEPWAITARIARSLAEEHDLVFATRDLRWRMVSDAS